jgi:hypothetical protein
MAVQEYGLPSRVRGDRGAENKKVSVFMILVRGLGRASFMWGSYVLFINLQGIHTDGVFLDPHTTRESNEFGLKSDPNLLGCGVLSFIDWKRCMASIGAIHTTYGFSTYFFWT